MMLTVTGYLILVACIITLNCMLVMKDGEIEHYKILLEDSYKHNGKLLVELMKRGN